MGEELAPSVPPSVEAAEAEREQVLAWISEMSSRVPQAQQRIAFLNGWITASQARVDIVTGAPSDSASTDV